jgi:hypothetical protein
VNSQRQIFGREPIEDTNLLKRSAIIAPSSHSQAEQKFTLSSAITRLCIGSSGGTLPCPPLAASAIADDEQGITTTLDPLDYEIRLPQHRRPIANLLAPEEPGSVDRDRPIGPLPRNPSLPRPSTNPEAFFTPHTPEDLDSSAGWSYNNDLYEIQGSHRAVSEDICHKSHSLTISKVEYVRGKPSVLCLIYTHNFQRLVKILLGYVLSKPGFISSVCSPVGRQSITPNIRK